MQLKIFIQLTDLLWSKGMVPSYLGKNISKLRLAASQNLKLGNLICPGRRVFRLLIPSGSVSSCGLVSEKIAFVGVRDDKPWCPNVIWLPVPWNRAGLDDSRQRFIRPAFSGHFPRLWFGLDCRIDPPHISHGVRPLECFPDSVVPER